MAINTLHNLEKQGLIIRKLLVPIPILKRQKKAFKKCIYVLCIELAIIILIQGLLTNPWKSEANYYHILKQRLAIDSHYFLGCFHVDF